MVASNQRLAEMYIVNLIQICIGDDEEHASLDIFEIKCKSNFQQCCMNLFTTDVVVVSHVSELLKHLLHHPDMFIEHVADVSYCLANLICFCAFMCLHCGTFVVLWIWPGIDWILTLQHFGSAIFIQERVTEFVVRDLTVLALVKVTHHDQNLLVRKYEAKLVQGLAELLLRDNTIMVSVKAAEDVTYQRELLTHTFSEFLQYSLQVNSGSSAILSDVLPCVLVHIQYFKLVVEDFYDISWDQVRWLEQPARPLVEMHPLFQELSSHNT